MIAIKLNDGKETTTYIQIYAPCNDSYPEEDRLLFFDQLSNYIDTIKAEENVVIMGDFNGRVGPRRTPWEQHLGPHSDHETKCNSNGEMLLNLCAEHGMILANTFFQHRKSQVKTWYKWNNLDKSSQIDFILVREEKRRTTLNCWVLPHYVIDTDHRPVVLKRRHTRNIKKARIKTQKIMNHRKLDDPDVKKKVQEELEIEFTKLPSETASVEEEWKIFTTATTSVLHCNCGTKNVGQTRKKGTIWWNDDVKLAVSHKKKCYKAWQKSKAEQDYITYRKARREAKRTIKRAKDNSWKNYGEYLSTLCRENPRDFAKSVRSMRVRDEPFNPTSVINDDKGTPIFNTTKAKERWREYFRELLNPSGENTEESPYIPPTPDNDDCPILESEVERAILDSPKNKAPPEDWQKAVIVPIWKKKGNKRDCGTYRGISLLSHSGKIYAKILERRLRPIIDPQLSHCQFGFRRNKGCTDAIFTLRQMCEKTIEFNKDLNIVFVDQEKAFDRVNRDTLWKVLERYGTDKQLLRNIMAFYEQSQGAVRTTSGLTEWFKINSGVRQGCVLSPLLFIAYMDNITQDAKRMEENETGAIQELLFADDQSLISEDPDALQAPSDRHRWTPNQTS